MNNQFNWQSFISIGLLISFIVMMFSGLVLYIAPEGSLSRWIGWSVLGLSKTQWEHQHTIFSYLFVIFSVFHIFKINWTIFWSYFFVKRFKFIYWKEILVAFFISIILFAGTLADIRPFNYVMKFGDNVSESYGRNVKRPDIHNPEKLTLEQFASQVYNISYDHLNEIIKKHQLVSDGKDQTIQNFCSVNDISPEEFYKLLSRESLVLDPL